MRFDCRGSLPPKDSRNRSERPPLAAALGSSTLGRSGGGGGTVEACLLLLQVLSRRRLAGRRRVRSGRNSLPEEVGDLDREYRRVMAEATETLDLTSVLEMLRRGSGSPD